MPQDERVTLERDHYCVKLYGIVSNAIQIRNMLSLPGVKVEAYGTGEERVLEVPKSFDYDEWMGEAGLIQQATRSQRRRKRERVKETQHESKALEGKHSQTKMWNITEEDVLPKGKGVGPRVKETLGRKENRNMSGSGMREGHVAKRWPGVEERGSYAGFGTRFSGEEWQIEPSVFSASSKIPAGV